MSAVVHLCPPDDSSTTPCCGRLAFELPRSDRMSTDPALVTCMTGSDPRITTPEVSP